MNNILIIIIVVIIAVVLIIGMALLYSYKVEQIHEQEIINKIMKGEEDR